MTGDCHRSPAWTRHRSESVDLGSGARAELLDTADYRVRDVNFAGDIGRHTQGKAELPFAEAMRAPLGEVGARAGELLNAIVAGVCDVDVAGGVRRHPDRSVELPIVAAH